MLSRGVFMSAGGWVGWLRVGHRPWEPAVQDAVHGECLALLLRHAETVPGSQKDLTVLKSGTDPNTRRVAHAHVAGASLAFVDASEASGSQAGAGRGGAIVSMWPGREGQEFERVVPAKNRARFTVPAGTPVAISPVARLDWRPYRTRRDLAFERFEFYKRSEAGPFYEFRLNGWLLRVHRRHVQHRQDLYRIEAQPAGRGR
jgi:hypothetical protein